MPAGEQSLLVVAVPIEALAGGVCQPSKLSGSTAAIRPLWCRDSRLWDSGVWSLNLEPRQPLAYARLA